MSPNDPTNDYAHDCLGCGRAVPECECDEDCYHCGTNPCECEEEEEEYDREEYDPDLDGAVCSADRHFLADWTRDVRHGGIGSMDAIARTQTKHGVGLGGYPWQKRANRRRAMQQARRNGRGAYQDDSKVPF